MRTRPVHPRSTPGRDLVLGTRALVLLVLPLAACGPGADEPLQPSTATPNEDASRAPAIAPTRPRKHARVAYEDALLWLQRAQAQDGGWQDGHTATDEHTDDPYVTSIALLAYYRRAYTNRGRHPFAKTVGNGLRWLKHRGPPNGGDKVATLHLAVTTSTWAEAFGMTHSLLWREPVRRGLAELAALARRGDLRDPETVGWTLVAVLKARASNSCFRQADRTPSLSIDERAFRHLESWREVSTTADARRLAVAALARVAFDPVEEVKGRVDSVFDRLAAEPQDRDLVAGLLAGYAAPFATSGHTRAWRDGWKTLADRQVGSPKDDVERGSWSPAAQPGYEGGRVRLTVLCANLETLMRFECYPPRIEDVSAPQSAR